MDEIEFEQALKTALESFEFEDDAWEGAEVRLVTIYEDAGMLTRNRGLVVRLGDGSEFQLTILQSEFAEEPEEVDG